MLDVRDCIRAVPPRYGICNFNGTVVLTRETVLRNRPAVDRRVVASSAIQRVVAIAANQRVVSAHAIQDIR